MYLLATMPESDWDNYYQSLNVMAKPSLETKNDESLVTSWYKVINLLCDLGELEKMYFPPLVSPTLGVMQNQILTEHKMALGAASYEWDPMYIPKLVGDVLPAKFKNRYIQTSNGDFEILPLPPDVHEDAHGDDNIFHQNRKNNHTVRPMDILDLGCGKGRIAHEMMLYTNGNVQGLNIDATQLQNAMRFALDRRLWPQRLNFTLGSFNDPLPFANESFDFVYEVGAFTYLMDKLAVFREIYRVLRPGGSFVYQDWTNTGYDPTNTTHADMMLRVKLISGLIELHDPKELQHVAEKAGFQVLYNGDGSYNATTSTSQLLSLKSFKFVDTIMENLIHYKILPQRMVKAWQTMRASGMNSLRDSVDGGLLNMGHVFMIRKPFA